MPSIAMLLCCLRFSAAAPEQKTAIAHCFALHFCVTTVHFCRPVRSSVPINSVRCHLLLDLTVPERTSYADLVPCLLQVKRRSLLRASWKRRLPTAHAVWPVSCRRKGPLLFFPFLCAFPEPSRSLASGAETQELPLRKAIVCTQADDAVVCCLI